MNRFLTLHVKAVGRRFNSHASHAHGSGAHTTAKSTFNNTHNFNINPPPVHEYWTIRNASILFAFIPVYLGIAYLTKYSALSADGFGGLIEFAKSDKSPMKDIKFGEPQLPK